MPVMVTGVDDALGAASARALLAAGGEVRVWLDAGRGAQDAVRWRAGGAKVARGEATDEGRLEAALEQVHTVVHCAGGPMEDAAAGTDHLATVVSAALGAAVRRLVWVTDLAADADASAERGADARYVAALAARRALVDALPIDVVVLRTGLRWGPGDRLTRWLAQHGSTLAIRSLHAPVWIPDVAAAVRAADAQRGSREALLVQAQLVGPDEVSLTALARRLASVAPLTAGKSGPEGHVSGEGHVGGAWPADEAALRAWLAMDARGTPDALGRDGTGVEAGLRALADGRPP